MTWRPSPQPPCPCGNCNQPPPKPVAKRECTEEDPCRFCGPVQFWDRDPAPVEPPPEPGHEKTRPLNREPGGVSAQPTAALGFTEFGQATVPRLFFIDRIRNARKDRK